MRRSTFFLIFILTTAVAFFGLNFGFTAIQLWNEPSVLARMPSGYVATMSMLYIMPFLIGLSVALVCKGIRTK